ncbi:hypothetical protein JCM10450v2_007612 [Rhodotorula kratochvilovae]
MDSRIPRALISPLLTTTYSLTLGTAQYALSRVSRHATPRLLALALAPIAARAVGAAANLHLSGTPRRGGERQGGSRRSWGIAGCEVARVLLQVYASRMNPVWVWASADLLIPLLALALPLANTPYAPPSSTRLFAAVTLAPLVTVWTWRTDPISAEGIVLAVLCALAETAKQRLTRDEAEECATESVEGTVVAMRDSSMRALALYAVAYVALYPLGLHEPYPAYSQTPLAGYQALWPIFTFIASTILPFALSSDTLDFSTATTAYSASNAFILALVALTGWQNAETSTFRFILFLLFATNALLQVFPRSSGDSSPEFAQKFGSYSSLGPSPSAHSPSLSLSRALALIPAVLPLIYAAYLVLTAHTLDIVLAHHSLAPSSVAHHLASVRSAPLARASRVRVYLYEKGDWTDEDLWRGLSGALHRGRDVIVRLPNAGREGGTYLEHITAHYNASLPASTMSAAAVGRPWRGASGARPFADHTLFLQEHLAWSWIAGPRLRRTLSTRSAFVSLGPYQTNLCGRDSEVETEMSGVADIFEMVKGRKCDRDKEGDRVLSTWAGQFAASRKTLLRNEFGVYERLRRMIEAPDDDPIHKQYNPTGPSTQSNPAFGHALERAWPLLLHCDDTRIAERCRDVAWEPEGCQCFEE